MIDYSWESSSAKSGSTYPEGWPGAGENDKDKQDYTVGPFNDEFLLRLEAGGSFILSALESTGMLMLFKSARVVGKVYYGGGVQDEQ